MRRYSTAAVFTSKIRTLLWGANDWIHDPILLWTFWVEKLDELL